MKNTHPYNVAFCFDEDGFYSGPLPKREGATLIGRHQGVFRTAAAACWPAGLCKWAAEEIIAAYKAYRDKGGSNDDIVERKRKRSLSRGREESKRLRPDEKGKDGKKRPRDEEQPVDPMDPPFPGGLGPPRSCSWKGYRTPFHDGGGLPSPGRWKRSKRSLNVGGT